MEACGLDLMKIPEEDQCHGSHGRRPGQQEGVSAVSDATAGQRESLNQLLSLTIGSYG